MTNAHRSSQVEAYNQLLLGDEFYKRANPEDWQRAVGAYRQAIAIDAGYAAAYGGLSRAEAFLADRTGDGKGMDRAIADAGKAIELAPGLADGYVSRGTSRLSFKRDWSGARADLEKALALSPGDSRVQVGYGRMMIALGRVPEAIAATRKAAGLDPLNADSWSLLGRMLNVTGEYAAAREALDRALELSPESGLSRYHQGMNSLLRGDARDALAIFRKDASAYGNAGIAMAEHTLGHAEESQQALAREIADYSQGAAYQIAEVYAWRGERDKAFEWLERAFAQQDGGLSFIQADPLMASLRSDARFKAFLEKMGLPL
jgi:tetratricopeptide (TPR) repeat protein